MMDEYITRNNAISAVCFGCNQQFSDEPCEPSECSIRQSIMALPTADVVPKSEVADLQDALKCEKETNKHLGAEYIALMKENEKLTINMNAYGLAAKRIAEEKADVASEIFELIECAFSPVLVYNGYTIKEYLAELKKKYIGESDVKRDTV